MINVLFDFPNNPGWIAGLHYFLNLFHAIKSLPGRRINPIILGPPENLPLSLRANTFIPRYSPPIPTLKSIRYVRNLLEYRFIGHSGDYDRYLQRHKIDLLSHMAFPSGHTNVAVLAWIPDFQHRHLPQYFSQKEIDDRCYRHAQIAEKAQGILLSSENARSDFNRFHPGFENKTHILRFVSALCGVSEHPAEEIVYKKYDIKEPYFHVPNQLWAHKNHSVILDALSILRKCGHCPLVISTGNIEDRRNIDYFPKLLQRVKDTGMEERFRFLGLIEYGEVYVLMRGAIALINPSLFEGWSTMVEEGKSLGKRLFLSSIAVHQEQANERTSFFEPSNSERLASLMDDTLKSYDLCDEKAAMVTAAYELPNRIRQYGLNYENIVFNILGHQ